VRNSSLGLREVVSSIKEKLPHHKR
jgi:hypothetical protein